MSIRNPCLLSLFSPRQPPPTAVIVIGVRVPFVVSGTTGHLTTDIRRSDPLAPRQPTRTTSIGFRAVGPGHSREFGNAVSDQQGAA